MSTRNWASVIPAALLTIGLSACGTAASNTANNIPTAVGEPDSLPPISVGEQSGDEELGGGNTIVDPFNLWFSGGKTHAELGLEVEVLVEDCMRTAGLEWSVPETSTAGEPATRSALAEFRATEGFGLYAGTQSSIKEEGDPILTRIESMNESELFAYLDVLEGPISKENVRTGGCQTTAQEQAFATLYERSSSPEAIRIWEEMNLDPRIVEANRLWTSCLEAEGLSDFPSNPRVFSNYIADNVDPSKDDAAENELGIAAIELACEQEHLWDVWQVTGQEALAQLAPLGFD